MSNRERNKKFQEFFKILLKSPKRCDIMIWSLTQGYSSAGRVPVSKTVGRGFESSCPCQEKSTCFRKCFFQRNPPLRVGEIRFACEIALRAVKFASTASEWISFHRKQSFRFHPSVARISHFAEQNISLCKSSNPNQIFQEHPFYSRFTKKNTRQNFHSLQISVFMVQCYYAAVSAERHPRARLCPAQTHTWQSFFLLRLRPTKQTARRCL